MSRISEIFETATETTFSKDGKTASLSPDNIKDLFRAIAKELANINFRHEIGCTNDDDFEIAKLIENHFNG